MKYWSNIYRFLSYLLNSESKIFSGFLGIHWKERSSLRSTKQVEWSRLGKNWTARQLTDTFSESWPETRPSSNRWPELLRWQSVWAMSMTIDRTSRLPDQMIFSFRPEFEKEISFWEFQVRNFVRKVNSDLSFVHWILLHQTFSKYWSQLIKIEICTFCKS